MNKHYSVAFILLFILTFSVKTFSQVNLPYTLHFDSNDPTDWADGIATDGDGGTDDINGLTIEIFAATSSFTLLPASTIVWHDNSYFASGDGAYTGITPGPDVPVTNNGIPAMVLRSANAANNFSLESLTLYDWGGTSPLTIEAFNNGTSQGSVQVNFDQATWPPETISQADVLTPSIFQNIDEVRFYPSSASEFWLSMNDIALAEASGTLPVTWLSFNASATNNTVSLEWQTAQEQNNRYFDIEHSNDGRIFRKAGEVQGSGNTAETVSYHYRVYHLSPGKHFFRIKQVDADGRAAFSRVVIVTVGDASRLSVYPNPVADILTIYAEGKIINELTIFNVSGKLLEKLEPHISQPVVNLSQYPPGIYFIQVRTAEGTLRRRVLKK